MSEPFWYDNPSVLFSPTTWTKFVPTAAMPVPEALNAAVRFVVYLSALLVAATMNAKYLLLVPAVLGITIVLKNTFPEPKKIEGFVSSYVGNERSEPTPDNPFMNASLVDIQDNPNRPPADTVTRKDVRAKVNESFASTSNLYMDTSDVFGLVQSQRNFYTVPEDDHAGLLAFLGKGGGGRSEKRLAEGYVVAKGTYSAPTTSDATAPDGTSSSRLG